MKHRFLPATAFIITFLLPSITFAHALQVFKIGEKTYSVEAGFLNEPLSVDDTNAVFLSVSLSPDNHVEAGEEGADHHDSANAVEGLERTLKVELQAGDKKKTLDLEPITGQKGQYTAVFIPTVPTTYTLRFTGSINDVPVDFSFICSPAGHALSEEDRTTVPLGEGVTRILKKGAFGCPSGKAELGFPEPAISSSELRAMSEAKGVDWGMIGAVLGGLGLLAGIGAWMKKS